MQLRAFFSALMPARFGASVHTLVAIALAILLHGMIAVLLLSAPNTSAPLTMPPIHVALVHEPAQSEPAVPDILPEPAIEPADTPPSPPSDSVASESRASAQPVEDLVSARSTSESVAAETNGNEDTYILSPATQSVLRGLQCPGDPDAFARTGICPQGAGRHSHMVASGERASDFYMIDVASIRAMFGQAPHALAGQSTLEDGTQRRSFTNADSMRDVLPAIRPDPAFGD